MMNRRMFLGVAGSVGLHVTTTQGVSAQAESTAPDVRLSLRVEAPDDPLFGMTYLDRVLKIVTDRAELLPGVLVDTTVTGEATFVVDLRSVSDPEFAIATLTSRGWVEFIDPKGELLEAGTVVKTSGGGVPWDASVGDEAGATPGPVFDSIVDSDDIVEVYTYRDQFDSLILGFRVNRRAAAELESFTSANVGNPMSIVIDTVVVSSPVLQGALSDQGVIQGLSEDEVNRLAIQLSVAPLPAKLVIEKQVVA